MRERLRADGQLRQQTFGQLVRVIQLRNGFYVTQECLLRVNVIRWQCVKAERCAYGSPIVAAAILCGDVVYERYRIVAGYVVQTRQTKIVLEIFERVQQLTRRIAHDVHYLASFHLVQNEKERQLILIQHYGNGGRIGRTRRREYVELLLCSGDRIGQQI